MADSAEASMPVKAHTAASIWHRLIPGAALTFHAVTESIVDRIVGSSVGCESAHSLWARSISFVLAWGFGLSVMKWTNFSHGSPMLHAVVNIVVVTAWLLAISNYPLVCWAGHIGPGEYDLSTQESRSIGLTRMTLVAVIEAATTLEIHSSFTNSSNPTTTTRTETNSHSSILEAYLPPGIAVQFLKWYQKAWRRHIPGVALTLQATLGAGIETAYGASPTCEGSSAHWRTLAFTISWLIGSISMLREGFSNKNKTVVIFVRITLTAVWLLSVSEVPLQCWIADNLVGILRLIMTIAVIFLAGVTERLEEDDDEDMDTLSAAMSTEYGAISSAVDH